MLALGLALPVFASDSPPEETVTVIEPHGEQRIEAISPSGEQHVQAIDPDEAQRISDGTQGVFRRGVDATAKVAVGVMAAVISVGATIAALLFL